MTQNNERQESAERLSKLIGDIPVAMLTTCLPDHSLCNLQSSSSGC